MSALGNLLWILFRGFFIFLYYITVHQLYMHYNQLVIDDIQLLKIIHKPVVYDTQLVIMHTPTYASFTTA